MRPCLHPRFVPPFRPGGDMTFADRYTTLVQDYVREADEAQLDAASKLGTELVMRGIPTEEVAEYHQLAIQRILAAADPAQHCADVDRAGVVLIEVLMAYGMLFRRRLDAAEQQLLVKVRELERSNKDLERFGFTVSHDLGAPLRTISSFLGLLVRETDGQLNERSQDYITRAVNAADRMRTLLQDVLFYSRMTKAEFTHVDTAAVAADLIADLDETIQRTSATIEIGELPTVHGSDALIRLLLGNLLNNALKFCRDDPPQVSVSAIRKGGRWEFCVADNGIGINPVHADRIFEVFQRLHGVTAYAGSGVGLAVVKRVVDWHGGRIWVESEEGSGAAFLFTLPSISNEEAG